MVWNEVAVEQFPLFSGGDACIVWYSILLYLYSGGGIVYSYRGGGCEGTGEQLGAAAHPIYTLAIICPLVTPTRQPPFNVPSIYHLVIVITALFFTFTAHVQFQFQLRSINQFNQKGKMRDSILNHRCHS